jgi:hypothetical protein
MLIAGPPRSRGRHLERVRVLERRRRHQPGQGVDLHVCRLDNRSSHGRCLNEVPQSPCLRLLGTMARHASNMPKTPLERPKKCIAGGEPRGPAQRGAPVWPDHKDGPCGPPRNDESLSAWAPRVGHCFSVALGRLHPDLGNKMENVPNPKQAASRH